MCLENKKLHLLCNCLNRTSFTLISNFNQPRHYWAFSNKNCIFLNPKSSIQPFYFLNTSNLLELGDILSCKNINLSKIKKNANMNKQRYLRCFLTFYILFLTILFFFLPCYVERGILVPLPGIKPSPPALEVQSPSHWTTRKSLVLYFDVIFVMYLNLPFGLMFINI